VAGGEDALEAEAVALEDISVAHRDVGFELEVRAFLDHDPLVPRRRPTRL